MKTYLITTGAIFGVITLVHIWRAISENPQLAKDPWYVGVTVLTGALSVWAWRLVGASSRK